MRAEFHVHEPECFAYDDTGMPYGSTSPECVCEIARAAYRRGREDAAKAVMTMKGAVREPVQIADIVALAIDAARGDGDQK